MNLLDKLGLQAVNNGACTGPGHWLNNKDNELLSSFNPTTEAEIAKVILTSEKEVKQLIETAHETFLSWRMMPAPKRGDIIRQIGNLLREKKSDLGDLISIEMGKSKQEADGEVQEMIDMADFAVGQSRMLYGKTMQSERPSHRMYEQWQPLGPITVITAFNFPVAVWAWNAFIAAICGNTIIWKPSSKTPLVAIAVQHICNKVMKDNDLSGVFSLCISNDTTVKNNLISDHRIPLVSFTGSSATGKKINEAVSQRMGRCILECSGNNAIIIDKSADLKLAVPAVLFGAIGTAGQRCTSTRRVFIPNSLFDSVSKSLTAAYKNIKIGDPLEPKNHIGPLIDQKAVENFEHAISRVKALGGEILVGGTSLNQTGFFVSPTIAVANNEWDIVQEETFAPVLYLIKYDSLAEAIDMQNNVKQGLSSAIFTQSIASSELFLSAKGSDCGIANVNIGTSGAEIGGAFGGEKETGGGREAGSDAWKAYMRRQTTTINWGDDLPLAQGINFNLE